MNAAHLPPSPSPPSFALAFTQFLEIMGAAKDARAGARDAILAIERHGEAVSRHELAVAQFSARVAELNLDVREAALDAREADIERREQAVAAAEPEIVKFEARKRVWDTWFTIFELLAPFDKDPDPALLARATAEHEAAKAEFQRLKELNWRPAA